MFKIGEHVVYKDGDDKTEYFVHDVFPATREYEEEICIIQTFPYYPDRMRQVTIWQKSSKFDFAKEL